MSIRATSAPLRRPFIAATAEFVAGKSSPRDYLELYVATIESLEPRIGAFVAGSL
ncbi:MAG TPA: hypothetical protein VN823_08105 [Stellaceae bacterium]|nr:hypothetical protein [Stellaceae bacterium]